jgi:hypothetical protein
VIGCAEVVQYIPLTVIDELPWSIRYQPNTCRG